MGIPSRLTSLDHPDAVNIINKLFDNYSARIDKVALQIATPRRITGQPTLVFGTIGAGSSAQVTVAVNGATTSLVATANPVQSLGNNHLTWTAFTTATDQVTVRVTNPTAGSIAVNAVKWNVLVS